MEKTFNIKVTMEEDWIPHFMSALKRMESLGRIGSSRLVAIFADGDGDFRPTFKTDIEFEKVSPLHDHGGNMIFDNR